MAVSLLAHEVSDLCLGKPPLRPFLTTSATVSDAILFFKRQSSSSPTTTGVDLTSNCLSVWSCNNNPCEDHSKCRCVGKVCMVDIICFLSQEDKLKNLSAAVQEPVSVLLTKENSGLVRHLDSQASLFEAIDLMLEGAQNIVIPIRSSFTRRRLISKPLSNSNREYCWITQEDIIRYLLNWIGLFSPLPNHTIQSLGLIDTQSILALTYNSKVPASSVLPLITEALVKQISVAVVDAERKLIGEISPFVLNYCDESAAAAIATLSAGDLMAYINYGGDQMEDLVQLIKEGLEERNLDAAVALIEDDSVTSPASSTCSSYFSSSDEEGGLGKSRGSSGRSSTRAGRNMEVTVCYPWSSLVAVMIQALSHRVTYVWVVEGDGSLVGVVTFSGMLKVLREWLKTMV